MRLFLVCSVTERRNPWHCLRIQRNAKPNPTHRVARPSLSAGSNLGRRGSQLCALLGACGKSGTLLVRCLRETREPSRRAPRTNGYGLAWVPARSSSRSVVRLQGPWPLRSGAGASFQSPQTSSRSLRQTDSRSLELDRLAFWIQDWTQTRGPVVRPARQRREHAEEPCDRLGLHLGNRRAAADSLARDFDL